MLDIMFPARLMRALGRFGGGEDAEAVEQY